MNKIIKDACILFAITLVAGIVLGAVYNITKGPIAEQNEKAKQTAYREVLSDADSFEAIDSEKYSEANLAALVSGLKDTEEDFSKDEVTDVVAGVKNGKIVGFVITVVAGDGYGGDIKFSTGISSDGKYMGTSILSISSLRKGAVKVSICINFRMARIKCSLFSRMPSGSDISQCKADILAFSSIRSTSYLWDNCINHSSLALPEILSSYNRS